MSQLSSIFRDARRCPWFEWDHIPIQMDLNHHDQKIPKNVTSNYPRSKISKLGIDQRKLKIIDLKTIPSHPQQIFF